MGCHAVPLGLIEELFPIEAGRKLSFRDIESVWNLSSVGSKTESVPLIDIRFLLIHPSLVLDIVVNNLKTSAAEISW